MYQGKIHNPLPQRSFPPESIISRHIIYKEIFPCSALSEDVKYFWFMEASRPLPFIVNSSGISKGYIDLIFTFEGNFCKGGESYLFGDKDMRFYIVGPLTQAQNISSAGAVRAIGIRIKPGRAFPYLRFPLHEITDRVIPVEDAWYYWDSSFPEKLCEEKNIFSKIKILENWLLHQKSRIPSLHVSVSHALNIIYDTKGLTTIEQLGDSLGIGFRQLQRKFLEIVGMSPKMLCKITKVRHAIDIFNHEKETNWIDVVHRCGFYDQSHFIRDFKSVTGITPGDYCSDPTLKYTIVSNMSDLYNTPKSKKCRLSF